MSIASYRIQKLNEILEQNEINFEKKDSHEIYKLFARCTLELSSSRAGYRSKFSEVKEIIGKYFQISNSHARQLYTQVIGQNILTPAPKNTNTNSLEKSILETVE